MKYTNHIRLVGYVYILLYPCHYTLVFGKHYMIRFHYCYFLVYSYSLYWPSSGSNNITFKVATRKLYLILFGYKYKTAFKVAYNFSRFFFFV